MEDKYDEVLLKYDFSVRSLGRMRGAILLNTDKGYKVMRETHASAGRLIWENKVMNHLKERNFVKIDAFNVNCEGNISTAGFAGVRYTVKDWYMGNECDMKNCAEVAAAAKNMANLHKGLMGIVKDDLCITAEPENILKVFERHLAELRRVRNYIRGSKDKNEFERSWLSVYEMYYEQAVKAVKLLSESPYEKILAGVLSRGEVSHGSYTYHNVYMCEDGVPFTTTFEKCAYGMQIMDLYYFLRKCMEKNEWNEEYGRSIISGYESIKRLGAEEYRILGILLLYPEKFWKLSSFYMNGKKRLMAAKNLKKLELLNMQYENRVNFVGEMVGNV
ncbi:MAG: CotS family spore coat protein [Lachnospiraceae bacterium]|nr:CotS family spore coat protein [Lachnospiraceae bacterium]